MATTVSYVLADAYSANGISGATVVYGGGTFFDILANLKTGGGDAYGRGGSFSTSDPLLISALDSSPALKRSGTSSPTPAGTPSVAGLAYIIAADANGNYGSRPNVTTPVIWIGPNPPASKAFDGDVWLSSTNTQVV